MKRLVLTIATALASIALVAPSSAAIATGAKVHTGLGVAAAPGAVDSAGALADVLFVAYHGTGATEIHITLCRRLQCAKHRATAPPEALTVSGAGYQVQADVPGLGRIDVRYGPGEGNQTRYECASTIGTFAMAGADVQASSVQGTLGPWALENRTCAAWGKDAAMQWNTL